jgi:hypothetical protein
LKFKIDLNFAFFLWTFVIHVTFFMKDLALSTMLSLRFQIFTPYTKLVEGGINLEVKDVLYNYTDATLMTTS